MGKETQSRYISIQLEILDATGNVKDAAIWGYIEGWERSKRTSKIRMHAGVAEIAKVLHMSDDAVSASLKRLVALELISYKRYDRGILITTNRDVIKSWSKAKLIPQNAVSDGVVKPQKTAPQRSRISRGRETAKSGRSLKSNPSLSPSSKSLENDNPKEEEVGQSITENQSTRASAVLPVAPSLSLSGRLLGMINAAFPSNPNAVLHQIRMSGWDERRVEAGLLKTDPRKGANYFASICRRMTDDEVEAMFAVPEAVPAEPKRVTSKDGRKVLINGEWLEAATPYPGLPAQAKPLPADHDPRLAEIYFIFWEEVCESLVPSIEGNLYWRIWQDLSDAGYEYKKGRMTADELRRKSEAILIEAGHPYTRKEGK